MCENECILRIFINPFLIMRYKNLSKIITLSVDKKNTRLISSNVLKVNRLIPYDCNGLAFLSCIDYEHFQHEED